MEAEGPTKTLEFLVVLAIDRIPTKEFLISQVWVARNDIMFDRTSMTIDMMFNPKMISLMWARAVHDEIQFLEGSWWFGSVKCMSSSNKVNEVVIHWVPSTHRRSKFIVAGVAKRTKLMQWGVVRRERSGLFIIFWAVSCSWD
ncbi:hypothetical protein Gogos_002113 [Gossypium gossypioides]|uniref:Uncharacterized protein n=1 Tax=Gossypium gossypioides TaxID=34282 RepID=A0A7J9CQE5_GOSGO|nr:hypothetical protein [Gossypium gossypioides]